MKIKDLFEATEKKVTPETLIRRAIAAGINAHAKFMTPRAVYHMGGVPGIIGEIAPDQKISTKGDTASININITLWGQRMNLGQLVDDDAEGAEELKRMASKESSIHGKIKKAFNVILEEVKKSFQVTSIQLKNGNQDSWTSYPADLDFTTAPSFDKVKLIFARTASTYNPLQDRNAVMKVLEKAAKTEGWVKESYKSKDDSSNHAQILADKVDKTNIVRLESPSHALARHKALDAVRFSKKDPNGEISFASVFNAEKETMLAEMKRVYEKAIPGLEEIAKKSPLKITWDLIKNPDHPNFYIIQVRLEP